MSYISISKMMHNMFLFVMMWIAYSAILVPTVLADRLMTQQVSKPALIEEIDENREGEASSTRKHIFHNNNRILVVDDEIVTDYECPSDVICGSNEFCGSDMTCHSYNCQTWYQYGPPVYNREYVAATSSVLPAIEDLACSTISLIDSTVPANERSYLTFEPYCSDIDSYPMAVQYHPNWTEANTTIDRCGRGASQPISSGPIDGVPFNRKCSARVSEDLAFVCYDMDPETKIDEYFSNYKNKSNNTSTIEKFHYYYPQRQGFLKGNDTDTVYLGFIDLESTLELNTTTSMTAIASVLFDINDETDMSISDRNIKCTNGCLFGEFCGVDMQCHKQNCINLFQYGTRERQESYFVESLDSLNDLQCTDIDESNKQNFPIAIRQQCQESLLWSFAEDFTVPDDTIKSTISFNRMCTASRNDNTFTCFDMSQNSNSMDYFDNFVSNRQACNIDELDRNNTYEDESTRYTGYDNVSAWNVYRSCFGNETYIDCIDSEISLYDFSVERAMTIVRVNVTISDSPSTLSQSSLSTVLLMTLVSLVLILI